MADGVGSLRGYFRRLDKTLALLAAAAVFFGCLIQFSFQGVLITINSMTLYDVPGKLTGTVRVRARRLQAGDRVLLQPSADGQIYYLLTKVVRP